MKNVTLAMPHAGVPKATWDPVNHIPMPQVGLSRDRSVSLLLRIFALSSLDL